MGKGICPKCGHEYDFKRTVPYDIYVQSTWFAHCKEENEDGTVTVYHNK